MISEHSGLLAFYMSISVYQAAWNYISTLQSPEAMVPSQNGDTLVEGGRKPAGKGGKISVGN